MKVSDVPDELVKVPGLAIIVLGLFLFVLGAAGQLPHIPQIQGPWRIGSAAMGVLLVIIGALFVYQQQGRNEPDSKERNHSGLNIQTEPLTELPTPTISIQPEHTTIRLGEHVPFMAIVSGIDAAVTSQCRWDIIEGPGKISADGVYYAPDVAPPGTHGHFYAIVQVGSHDLPGNFARAVVTILC